MYNIVLLVFTIICFLLQVGFSIFYSINIVDISNEANQVQKKLETSQIELQLLKAKYLEQSSLMVIQKDPSTKSLLPITKTVTINP
ncbi:hypothetical protein HYV64_03085 [Candidatus Shapirobacteria bacterium]|nr:hypothetical protein [Candidatus Shapirobacteria bacterium]